MKTPIAFEFTSEMYAWIHSTQFAGPCSAVDSWTYGRILIEPMVCQWREFSNGGWHERSKLSYKWRTY